MRDSTLPDKVAGAEPEIESYSLADFQSGTAPYDYVYQFHDDGFRLQQELDAMEKIAKAVGYRGFKKTYQEYVKNISILTNIAPDGCTQFTGQELDLQCGRWRADDTGVYLQKDNGSTEYACTHPIAPVERLVNVDTGIVKTKLAFRRGSGGWRYVVRDRKTLASNAAILDLADDDIAVTSENSRLLVRYLHDVDSLNYDDIPTRMSVSRMGWIDQSADLAFSPYIEDLVFDGESNFKRIYESIKTHGEYESWIFTARAARLMSLPARVMLAASFASVLIKPVGVLPFFTHVWGGTEAGKTVGLMLATSVWACPDKGNYWQTFDSTEVGLERTVGFLNSLPVCLDELQTQADRKSFDKTLYKLTEGAGRTRGSRTGGIQHTEYWSCVFITTGEMPITGALSGGGAVNRVIEVECKDKLFTNPREIAQKVQLNYGFAGMDFIAGLQKSGGVEAAKGLYQKYYSKLAELKDITDKQIGAAALLLTADFLATQWIFEDGQELTVEDIKPLLKTKKEVSTQDRAYEFLMDYFTQNKNKFCGESDDREVWGKYEDGTFKVLPSVFDRACADNGISGKALKSWMRDNDLLDIGKGFTKSVWINGMTKACICIRQKELPEDMLGENPLDDEEIHLIPND